MIAMQGSCHPAPCEIAPTPLHVYTTSVSDRSNVRAATAIVRTTFSETILVLTPDGEDRLRVDAYDRFTDNSDRADYTWSETFSRK